MNQFPDGHFMNSASKKGMEGQNYRNNRKKLDFSNKMANNRNSISEQM